MEHTGTHCVRSLYDTRQNSGVTTVLYCTACDGDGVGGEQGNLLHSIITYSIMLHTNEEDTRHNIVP